MTVTQTTRINAALILEGFCWMCEKPLDREGWCQTCERRFIVRLEDIEEWLPVPEELWGKLFSTFTGFREIVRGDGERPDITYIDGEPIVPNEPCWLTCEWRYR